MCLKRLKYILFRLMCIAAVPLVFLTGGAQTGSCSTEQNANGTLYIHCNEGSQIPSRNYDIPWISNGGVSAWVTVVGGYGLVVNVASQSISYSFGTISDTHVTTDTVFNWIVTPGDATGTGSVIWVVWFDADATNPSINYTSATVGSNGVSVAMTTSITNNVQPGVSNITLATNSSNDVVAAWQTPGSGPSGAALSQFLVLSSPPGSNNDGVMNNLFNPFSFGDQTAVGSSPPRIAIDDNHMLCALQSGVVTGGAYSDNIACALIDLSIPYINPAATGLYAPSIASAPVTVKSFTSGGFYMLTSNHLATDPSQSSASSPPVYLALTTVSGVGTGLTFPDTALPNALSTVETVWINYSQPVTSVQFTSLTSTANTAVFAADVVATTVTTVDLLADGQLTQPQISGVFVSTPNNQDLVLGPVLDSSSYGAHSIFGKSTITGIINSNPLIPNSNSPFVLHNINIAVQIGLGTTLVKGNLTLVARSNVQNFSNWIAFLTQSSPLTLSVYNFATGSVVFQQQITSESIQGGSVAVNSQGIVVVFWQNSNGQVFSKTFDVSNLTTNGYSRLQNAFKLFSPLKTLKGVF